MRLLALLLLSSGCSVLTAHTDPTRFFVLTSNDHASDTPVNEIVGLDHVDLPEYLVRDEMVTREATNQLNIAQYDRWGEPLKDGFARALRRDLESDLGAGRAVAQPYDPSREPTLLLDVEVHHLEHVAGKGALLDVRWTLRERKTGTVVIAQDDKQESASPDKDTGASVGALSKTVAGLAADIAKAVRDKK